MSTYISMVTWSGNPQPTPADIRSAVLRRDDELRRRGLHSVALLPDEGSCAAVMVASVPDETEAERIAAELLPDAQARVDSMRFDDGDDAAVGGAGAGASPPPPRRYLHAVYRAVVGT